MQNYIKTIAKYMTKDINIFLLTMITPARPVMVCPDFRTRIVYPVEIYSGKGNRCLKD
jgi:hypothetical protein